MALFHIASRSAWAAAQASGAYRGTLDSEGFIHLSTDRQWLGVANRLFRGHDDLVLLVIRPDRLQAEVKTELVETEGKAYPHLYGELPVSAVVEAHELLETEAGFDVPEPLRPWRHFFE